MATVKKMVSAKFLKIDKGKTIGQLMGALKKSKERTALVFDGKQFLGIIRKVDLLRSRDSVGKRKVRNVIKPIVTISEDMDVLQAAYLMFNVDANLLPVERKGKIVGVVKIFDIITQLKKYEPIKHFMVREVKYGGVVAVDEEERIGTALHLMHEFHTYNIPVMRAGKLTGILSVSDIFSKYITGFPVLRERSQRESAAMRTRGAKLERPDILALPVKSFDTGYQQITIEESAKLAKAADIMKKDNVMCVVVTKNKRVVGVLTANNVLRALAALYVGPEFNIQFVGLKKTRLEPYQVVNLKQIVSNEAAKLRHYFHGDFVLRIRVKSYGKGGKREKYSITMLMESAGKSISTDDHDWDIETAIRKNFKNLRKRITHTFRSDTTWDKPYEA